MSTLKTTHLYLGNLVAPFHIHKEIPKRASNKLPIIPYEKFSRFGVENLQKSYPNPSHPVGYNFCRFRSIVCNRYKSINIASVVR